MWLIIIKNARTQEVHPCSKSRLFMACRVVQTEYMTILDFQRCLLSLQPCLSIHPSVILFIFPLPHLFSLVPYLFPQPQLPSVSFFLVCIFKTDFYSDFQTSKIQWEADEMSHRHLKFNVPFQAYHFFETFPYFLALLHVSTVYPHKSCNNHA